MDVDAATPPLLCPVSFIWLLSPGPASRWELHLLHTDRSQEPPGLWREMGQAAEELTGANGGGSRDLGGQEEVW